MSAREIPAAGGPGEGNGSGVTRANSAAAVACAFTSGDGVGATWVIMASTVADTFRA